MAGKARVPIVFFAILICIAFFPVKMVLAYSPWWFLLTFIVAVIIIGWYFSARRDRNGKV